MNSIPYLTSQIQKKPTWIAIKLSRGVFYALGCAGETCHQPGVPVEGTRIESARTIVSFDAKSGSCITWAIQEGFSDISPYESRPKRLASDVIYWTIGRFYEHIESNVECETFSKTTCGISYRYERILCHPCANLSLNLNAATWVSIQGARKSTWWSDAYITNTKAAQRSLYRAGGHFTREKEVILGGDRLEKVDLRAYEFAILLEAIWQLARHHVRS